MTPTTLPAPVLDALAADIRAAYFAKFDKPQARAWATKKTVWFVLPRRACASHLRAGQWITVTRTHPATPKRIATIKKWKRAQQAQPADTITRWDGKVFVNTGRFEKVPLGSRTVAARNRKYAMLPVYECAETGETFVLAAQERQAATRELVAA